MECRDPVIRRRWRQLGATVLLAISALAGAAAPPNSTSGDRVVLVVAVANPVTSLDAIDLKRLFLGVPVVAAGRNLHALLNDSDVRLRMIFHQHVVGMSLPMYERRLLQLTLEQGRRMPAVFVDGAQLLTAVAGDPLAVSYAWASAVVGNSRLRVVRELWRE